MVSGPTPKKSSHEPSARVLALAYTVCRHPRSILASLSVLAVVCGLLASTLTINSNQLDLISQDLRQVKDVRRVIDMVGGSGFLMLALRSDDEPRLKATADAVAAMLEHDKEHVRSVTYRMPVEFVQKNVGLFVKTPDLMMFRDRVNDYLRAMARFENPFFVRLRQAKKPTINVEDIVEKYSHVGKKTILDEYYISGDKKMVLILIKPMWDTNDLSKTNEFVEDLRSQFTAFRGGDRPHLLGTTLAEDYKVVGAGDRVTFGLGGSYMSSLDDSFAIQRSLEPVSLWAFCGIVAITVLFFRKWVPSLIVLSGMVVGTLLTMGFCRVSVGQLNMITSILGGILMGFGVDYGIHFIFRTRIELGAGRKPHDAVAYALAQAGRPALIAAVVTSGSFMTLMASTFRGFSQFGFLAGCGTIIIGVTMFAWCAAWVALIADWRPEAVAKLIGTLKLSSDRNDQAGRVPRPKLLLAVASTLVFLLCFIAVPKSKGTHGGFWARVSQGVRFNYNSRALMAEDQYSVVLQDEINQRFSISSDPVAIVTSNLEETQALYETMTQHPERFPSVDQVMSLYTFVPPRLQATRNSEIMQAWKKDLQQFNFDVLDEQARDQAKIFMKALDAKPYDVHGVPEVYSAQFYNLPETRPENRGLLTFLYPRVDLWDGEQMLRFADEVDSIKTQNAGTFHAAGAPMLFAQLARIVLFDGKLTLALAALWILVMHYLDFRSIVLATASVLPLVLGLGMMLGLMAATDHPLNFMNIVMLPILLGFGVSHGLYLLHRFLEGVPTVVALKSVGAAVASSTCTAIAGFASLFAASHQGLKSMGYVACLGLTTTLIASFTVLAAVLQLIEDRQNRMK